MCFAVCSANLVPGAAAPSSFSASLPGRCHREGRGSHSGLMNSHEAAVPLSACIHQAGSSLRSFHTVPAPHNLPESAEEKPVIPHLINEAAPVFHHK